MSERALQTRETEMEIMEELACMLMSQAPVYA